MATDPEKFGSASILGSEATISDSIDESEKNYLAI